jgi:hypothetical protein
MSSQPYTTQNGTSRSPPSWSHEVSYLFLHFLVPMLIHWSSQCHRRQTGLLGCVTHVVRILHRTLLLGHPIAMTPIVTTTRQLAGAWYLTVVVHHLPTEVITRFPLQKKIGPRVGLCTRVQPHRIRDLDHHHSPTDHL